VQKRYLLHIYRHTARKPGSDLNVLPATGFWLQRLQIDSTFFIAAELFGPENASRRKRPGETCGRHNDNISGDCTCID
jgi:hypothetical protein